MTKKELIESLQQRTWIPPDAKIFFNDQRGNLIEATALIEVHLDEDKQEDFMGEKRRIYRAPDEDMGISGVNAVYFDNYTDWDEIGEMIDADRGN